MDKINTLRYADIFLAIYFDDGMSCLHRNHSHVLVYMYSGELEINERGKITRLHKGDCAFIRKDLSVQLTKQGYNGEQFKAIFLMFTTKFLHEFYSKMDKSTIPEEAKRGKVSLLELPSKRPDITSLFESMTPYFNSSMQPTDALLNLKMMEGVYILLNTDKNLYASLFDFTEPWKINILDFLEKNFMNDLSMEEIANYTGRSLAVRFSDLRDGKVIPKRFTPQQIREHLEASLRRLHTDYIDLYYQHRVCPDNVEEVAIPTCKELGIEFVPFSPLASGFLIGKVSTGSKYEGDDVRRAITRFKDENIVANQPMFLQIYYEKVNYQSRTASKSARTSR